VESVARVFELGGRSDEAEALIEEAIEIAERYGHLVAAEGRATGLLLACNQPRVSGSPAWGIQVPPSVTTMSSKGPQEA
jgi:hypothetical protein